MKNRIRGAGAGLLLFLGLACSKPHQKSAKKTEKGDVFFGLPVPGISSILADGVILVRYQYGPVLVLEFRGKDLFPSEDVVVRSQADKKLVTGLFDAAFPDKMNIESVNLDNKTLHFHFDLTSIGFNVYTVDEYLRQKEDGSRRSGDHKGLEEVMGDLGKNFAVVYRYLNTGKFKDIIE